MNLPYTHRYATGVSRWKIMYVLYEDSGNFKAEKIFSQSDSTMQVESESGKRSKIKNASVLFSFDNPRRGHARTGARAGANPRNRFFMGMRAARRIRCGRICARILWAPARAPSKKPALIFALNSAPAYFHRRGKGRYRPAPPDILAAALAAIEKKQNRRPSNRNGPIKWLPANCRKPSPKSPAPC